MRFYIVALTLFVSGSLPLPGGSPKGGGFTATLCLNQSTSKQSSMMQQVHQCEQTATITITSYAFANPALTTIYELTTKTITIYKPPTQAARFHGALHPILAPSFANSTTTALKTDFTNHGSSITTITPMMSIRSDHSPTMRSTGASHFLLIELANITSGVLMPSKTVAKSTEISVTRICATPTCGEHGAKFTQFSNPYSGDYSSTYDSFDLKHFENDRKPVRSGIINKIYLKTNANNETFSHTALEFRTFLYACKNGTYTFTSQRADDATLMWFGEASVKNSTRENADIQQFYYGNNLEVSVQKRIVAGTYYPIRVLWGNTEGSGFLSLEIYGPDGEELTHSTGNDTNSFLVTEACDTRK